MLDNEREAQREHRMTKWSSRWFLMSVVLSVGAFVLSWKFGEASSFTAIATVALGGGHFTNVMERRNPPRDEAL